MGVLKSICEIASLGGMAPADVIALATGNNAAAFRLAGSGTLAVGEPADLVVCDAPNGGVARDALAAIARGDIPGISCIVIDGEVRVARSRNTPLATRLAAISGSAVAAGAH
jgi:enamidase